MIDLFWSKNFVLALLVLLSPLYLQAESLETIKMGENKFIQFSNETKQIAKVRIPIKIYPYEKVLIYGSSGEKRQEFRQLPPMEHTLRARIEQVNHFYIGEWHIETIPQSWSRASRVLELDVRVYKRYGEQRELEESIGKMRLKSILQGEDFVYNAQGFAQSRFVNKNAQPIVRIELGRLYDNDTVAKSQSNTQEDKSFSR